MGNISKTTASEVLKRFNDMKSENVSLKAQIEKLTADLEAKNKMISAYDVELNTAKARINVLESSESTLNSTLEAYSKDRVELQKEINDKTAEIKQLKEEISKFSELAELIDDFDDDSDGKSQSQPTDKTTNKSATKSADKSADKKTGDFSDFSKAMTSALFDAFDILHDITEGAAENSKSGNADEANAKKADVRKEVESIFSSVLDTLNNDFDSVNVFRFK